MSKGAKLSLLLISLIILLMAALMSGVIKSEHWKIKDIALQAEYKRVSSEQIRVVVSAYPERSFFKVKADDIREKIIMIPWVQEVSVTKKWPNSLVIKIIEHQAVAVWNKDKLLNENGQIFEVDSIDNLMALPRINGKDSQSQLIWDQYMRFSDIVKNTGLDITSSFVSNRGGWDLFLSNGINLRIGTNQMDARLVRLADSWSKLLQQNDNLPTYIDLRYTNGYAVKWPQRTEKLEEQNKKNMTIEQLILTEGLIDNNG